MHEYVSSDAKQAKCGVIGETATRPIGSGFRPCTLSFPPIVRSALLIESADRESKRGLDEFVAAMQAIAEEVETDPELVGSAPATPRTSRVK